MPTTVSLQAVTDRVRGVVSPMGRLRPGPPSPGDRFLATTMLTISGGAAAGGLALWAAGHGPAGLRLACGAILVLFAIARLR